MSGRVAGRGAVPEVGPHPRGPLSLAEVNRLRGLVGEPPIAEPVAAGANASRPPATPADVSVAAAAGGMPLELRHEPITYRQLCHWIIRFRDLFSEGARPGRSGLPRRFTDADVQRLRRMARLVDAGLRPELAARVAADDSGEVRLSEHVVVRVTP